MGRSCTCCDSEVCELISEVFHIDRYGPSVKVFKQTIEEKYHITYEVANGKWSQKEVVLKEKVSTKKSFSTFTSVSDIQVGNFAWKKVDYSDSEYTRISSSLYRVRYTYYKYIVQYRTILRYTHDDILDWSDDLYLAISLRLGDFGGFKDPEESFMDIGSRYDPGAGFIGAERVRNRESKVSGFITDKPLNISNFQEWDDIFPGGNYKKTLDGLDYDVVDIKDFHPKENSNITFLIEPAYTGDEFLDDFLDDSTQERQIYYYDLGNYYSHTRATREKLAWLEVIRPSIEDVNRVVYGSGRFDVGDESYISAWQSKAWIGLDWHKRWERKTMWNFVSKVSFLGKKTDLPLQTIASRDFINADGVLNMKFFKPKINNTKKGAEKVYADVSFYTDTVKDFYYYGESERECGEDMPDPPESLQFNVFDPPYELEKTLTQPEVMLGGYHYSEQFGEFRRVATQRKYYPNKTDVKIGLYRLPWDRLFLRMENKTSGIIHTLESESQLSAQYDGNPAWNVYDGLVYIKNCLIQFPSSYEDVLDEFFNDWVKLSVVRDENILFRWSYYNDGLFSLISDSVPGVYPRFRSGDLYLPSRDNYVYDRMYPDNTPIWKRRTNFYTDTENCHIEFSFENTRGFLDRVVSFDTIDQSARGGFFSPVTCEDICGLFELEIKDQVHDKLNLVDLGSVSYNCGITQFSSRSFNSYTLLESYADYYKSYIAYEPKEKELFFNIGNTGFYDYRYCINHLPEEFIDSPVFGLGYCQEDPCSGLFGGGAAQICYDFTDEYSCPTQVVYGFALAFANSPNPPSNPAFYRAYVSMPFSSRVASFLPVGAEVYANKFGWSNVSDEFTDPVPQANFFFLDPYDSVFYVDEIGSDVEAGWVRVFSSS